MGYTYIVDSNQKLEDWANNVAGNDYTKVLIKSGNWESSVGVNLTTTGTKIVVGEPDNLLKFSNTTHCLHYDSIPDSLDYYMTGVNVESNNNSSYTYGFSLCTNLTNCNSSCTSTVKGKSGCGFINCTKLINCNGTGISTGASFNSSGFGFNNCINLTNCTGSGSGRVSYGFNYCDNLTNCTVKGNNGFNYCDNLTNCTGTIITASINSEVFRCCTNLTNCTGDATGDVTGFGFFDCTSLTNCIGSGSNSGDGTNHRNCGFDRCKNLTNCTGTGNNGSGYGFYGCEGVLKCKAGGNCSTSVFAKCYSTIDGKFEVADTPAGGFNNTTNPDPV